LIDELICLLDSNHPLPYVWSLFKSAHNTNNNTMILLVILLIVYNVFSRYVRCITWACQNQRH